MTDEQNEARCLKVLQDLRNKSFVAYQDVLYSSDKDDRKECDFQLARWTGYSLAISEITGETDGSHWMVNLLTNNDIKESKS